MSIANAIAKVLAAFEREGWTPKELHLSNDDWWKFRDEIRSLASQPAQTTYFDGNRLGMFYRNVRVVTNHTFESGNYRFDPIAPASVGARMMEALAEFRSGIKGS